MKLKSLVASVALIAGMLSASPAFAQVKWRMPAAVPEGSFFYETFMKRFADNVKLITGGKVIIEPYGAGVLVPAFKVYEAVADGTVEAGHSTPSYLVNADPTNAIFASYPGGMSPEATLAWLYQGGGEKMLKDFRREKMKLHTLIVGVGSSEVLAHSNKPIRTRDDFKGMKYRTSGAFAAVLKELGAIPTVVAPAEIYTLLERKGVDAIEWATPGSNLSEGFHKVAKYLVLPGIHQPTFLWEVVLKQETWDKLPKDLQEQVEAAARLTTLEALPKFQYADAKALDVYRANGNEIITLDPKLVDEIRQIGIGWAKTAAAAAKAKGDDRMEKVLASYLGYQALWAKNSSYMIRD
jgi:TRAP-type mannitol/chloroaromatic compound transport system substrate-binding protein